MPTKLTTSKMGKIQRDSLKNTKRAASQYRKIKGAPPVAKKNTATIYDPVKKRVDAMKRANPIGSMVTGIQDTVKYAKSVRQKNKEKKAKVKVAQAVGAKSKKKA